MERLSHEKIAKEKNPDLEPGGYLPGIDHCCDGLWGRFHVLEALQQDDQVAL